MIGVPTLHDHDLRHSGSNILKDLGMEIQDIAELLHHESTETTVKHYLTVNKKKVKKIKINLYSNIYHYLPAHDVSSILCYTISEDHNTGGIHSYGKTSKKQGM